MKCFNNSCGIFFKGVRLIMFYGNKINDNSGINDEIIGSVPVYEEVFAQHV